MSRNAPNGCGPWWVSKRFKDTYFIDACEIHDRDYIDGVDRRKADLDFYERMKEIIRKDKSLNYWQRKLRYTQAWSFYHIVRRFGWSSHKDGWNI